MKEILSLEILLTLFWGSIIVDFILGVMAAWKKGKLKSRTCSEGMFRSIGEVIVLLMFIGISYLMPDLEPILVTFMCGFIFKEGISIAENLEALDVWIPKSIKNALEVGADKVDKLEIKEEDK